MKTMRTPIGTGIEKACLEGIVEGLARMLGDTYTLYLKAHNFRWNVMGPMFQTLHLMFKQHYNELWIAVDGIAERIRALLGALTPGTYEEFHKLSPIKEYD